MQSFPNQRLSAMKIFSRAAAAAIVAVCGFSASAQLTFSGNSKPAITETPGASTGLKEVYVLRDAAGVKASYTSSGAVTGWKRFNSMGGGYAEDIPYTTEGNVTTITLSADDMGYIVEENGRQVCFWVVNYANHICSLRSLEVSPELDCSTTTLLFQGEADRINYYSINGAAQQLSRGLTLEYNTLEYDTESQSYRQKQETEQISSVNEQIHCMAPLCDTEFTLSGDRFQQAWGEAQEVTTPTFTTNAIAAVTTATQEQREADNEQTSGDEGTLGGSAPAVITFQAAVTDAVVFREWQFARDELFDLIDLRVNEDETVHTFDEYGTTYVRFVCGNADNSCEYTSEVYPVYIGESRLECPNAFSPNDDGVNDEWRVSYRSLIDFDCHIYNRWGQEMCHFTDPAKGWDGKYNGKTVPSGVYYYVIKATGSDGKNYKKAGDINIINYSRSQNAGTGSDTPEP